MISHIILTFLAFQCLNSINVETAAVGGQIYQARSLLAPVSSQTIPAYMAQSNVAPVTNAVPTLPMNEDCEKGTKLPTQNSIGVAPKTIPQISPTGSGLTPSCDGLPSKTDPAGPISTRSTSSVVSTCNGTLTNLSSLNSCSDQLSTTSTPAYYHIPGPKGCDRMVQGTKTIDIQTVGNQVETQAFTCNNGRCERCDEPTPKQRNTEMKSLREYITQLKQIREELKNSSLSSNSDGFKNETQNTSSNVRRKKLLQKLHMFMKTGKQNLPFVNRNYTLQHLNSSAYSEARSSVGDQYRLQQTQGSKGISSETNNKQGAGMKSKTLGDSGHNNESGAQLQDTQLEQEIPVEYGEESPELESYCDEEGNNQQAAAAATFSRPITQHLPGDTEIPIQSSAGYSVASLNSSPVGAPRHNSYSNIGRGSGVARAQDFQESPLIMKSPASRIYPTIIPNVGGYQKQRSAEEHAVLNDNRNSRRRRARRRFSIPERETREQETPLVEIPIQEQDQSKVGYLPSQQSRKAKVVTNVIGGQPLLAPKPIGPNVGTSGQELQRSDHSNIEDISSISKLNHNVGQATLSVLPANQTQQTGFPYTLGQEYETYNQIPIGKIFKETTFNLIEEEDIPIQQQFVPQQSPLSIPPTPQYQLNNTQHMQPQMQQPVSTSIILLELTSTVQTLPTLNDLSPQIQQPSFVPQMTQTPQVQQPSFVHQMIPTSSQTLPTISQSQPQAQQPSMIPGTSGTQQSQNKTHYDVFENMGIEDLLPSALESQIQNATDTTASSCLAPGMYGQSLLGCDTSISSMPIANISQYIPSQAPDIQDQTLQPEEIQFQPEEDFQPQITPIQSEQVSQLNDYQQSLAPTMMAQIVPQQLYAPQPRYMKNMEIYGGSSCDHKQNMTCGTKDFYGNCVPVCPAKDNHGRCIPPKYCPGDLISSKWKKSANTGGTAFAYARFPVKTPSGIPFNQTSYDGMPALNIVEKSQQWKPRYISSNNGTFGSNSTYATTQASAQAYAAAQAPASAYAKANAYALASE